MSYYDYNEENRGGFLRSIPPAVKSIIIISVLVGIMSYLNPKLMGDLFALDRVKFIFMPWQLVTYMFMHGGLFHLFFNMYTLFIFGSVLERVWGTKKFLVYYFATGIGAALFHIGVQWITGDNAHTVGASGAIYGLLLGYAMLYPDSVMGLIFPPVRMKAKWFVLIFAAIELLLGLTGTQADVAHFAHLGGLLVGLVIVFIWKKTGKLYSRRF